MTRDPTIHVEWLDAFLIWAESHGTATRCRPTEKPAGTLDIDTEHVVSNITYWSSGECDAAILDVSSGQSVYQRSWSDLQPADFDSAFAPWLAIVRGEKT